MSSTPFVPPDFRVPRGLDHRLFRLRPLGPEHNEADYRAWTLSIEHIRRTPGFEGRRWPAPMTLAENADDLAAHARDFTERTGFTYTVLAADGGVIGCVYVYPSTDGEHDASVRSWVSADQPELDRVLYEVILDWLQKEWPFHNVDYAARPAVAD